MARQFEDRPLPLPVRARRLAAQIGRNFSETIHMLIKLDGDVEGVVRYFDDLDAAPPEPPAFEPIVICKSESEVIVVDPPSNAAAIDDAVARGALAPAVIGTARGVRTIYASPCFAKYLSAVYAEGRERDDIKGRG